MTHLNSDFRDQLLTWLALREESLRLELNKDSARTEFVKGELVSVMETTAYILTEGVGF